MNRVFIALTALCVSSAHTFAKVSYEITTVQERLWVCNFSEYGWHAFSIATFYSKENANYYLRSLDTRGDCKFKAVLIDESLIQRCAENSISCGVFPVNIEGKEYFGIIFP